MIQSVLAPADASFDPHTGIERGSVPHTAPADVEAMRVLYGAAEARHGDTVYGDGDGDGDGEGRNPSGTLG